MSDRGWLLLCGALLVGRLAGAQPIDEAEVITTALAHNPSLAAAALEQRRAALEVESEEHALPFTLTLDASAAHTETPTLGVNGVAVVTSRAARGGAELGKDLAWGTQVRLRVAGSATESDGLGPGLGTSAKLSVSQPLLRGAGRKWVRAGLDRARLAEAAAEFTRTRTASQLLLDVLTAYWELHYAGRAVAIQRQSLALAEARVADTEARVRTGSAAPVDLLALETRVASLEEDVQSALAEEQRRAAELARLTGDESLAARSVGETLPPTPGPIPPDTRDRLMADSPELAESFAAVRLAEVEAQTAGESFRPRLDLDAFVEAQGLGDRDLGASFEQLAGRDAVSGFLSLTLELPLDPTQRRAARTRAELAVAVAQARATATAQRLVAELSRALTGMESARRRIDLAVETRALAARQVEAESARYRTGSGTLLAVRAAEDDLRSAELREARARVDLLESSLIVEHLTGRLLARGAGR
jgi:outer membrane protein